jgi:RNA polymerase sigma factor (sigma-70 family)
MAEDTWQNEQRLLHGLRAHDLLSLEALMQHYSRELFYVACLILAGVGTAQDAEECLNDLFVTVWQEFDSFDPARGSLRTWLMMRTKYIALDCRRYLLRHQSPNAPTVVLHEAYYLTQDHRSLDSLEFPQGVPNWLTTAGVDVVLEQQERLEGLRHAIEDLPAFDRFLIDLRYFQSASMREIAARTGLTRHALEARLWRARKTLRARLQEWAPGIQVNRASLRAGRSASLLRKEGLPA